MKCSFTHNGVEYKSTSAKRILAKEYFLKICARYQINPDLITGRDHSSSMVKYRVLIARELMNTGFSSKVVGYVMHRDHSTVLYYTRDVFAHLGV